MRRRHFLKFSATLPASGFVGLAPDAALGAESSATIDAARRMIREPSRDIPVTHEADVIVVGATLGGLGGCFAAIAAARLGAKTLLIEESGHIDPHVPIGLGVVIGINGWQPSINEGLFQEFADYVVKTGQHADRPLSREALLEQGGLVIRYHEIVTTALLAMLRDAGVDFLFHTKFVDAVIDDGRIKALVVESPQGRHALMGKAFVDSTGLGDVAAAAGAPMLREEAYQGLQAFMAQVDETKYSAWTKENNQPLDAGDRAWLEGIVGPFERLEHPWNQWWPELLGDRYPNAYVRKLKAAQQRGDVTLLHRRGPTGILAIPEGLKTNPGIARPRTYITGLDPLNAADVSWAEVTSRLALMELMRFLRQDIPGFEHCVMERIADSLSLRGGRYIDVPQRDQLRTAKALKTPDAIFVMKKGGDDAMEIPYAALIPQRVDGLLVVGKASGGGRTLGTAHVAVFQGQAAGTAAALAAHQGISPRLVAIPELQARLRAAGVHIPD
jgi:hypothetical protein